jgi:hypothetical protein
MFLVSGLLISILGSFSLVIQGIRKNEMKPKVRKTKSENIPKVRNTKYCPGEILRCRKMSFVLSEYFRFSYSLRTPNSELPTNY